MSCRAKFNLILFDLSPLKQTLITTRMESALIEGDCIVKLLLFLINPHEI